MFRSRGEYVTDSPGLVRDSGLLWWKFQDWSSDISPLLTQWFSSDFCYNKNKKNKKLQYLVHECATLAAMEYTPMEFPWLILSVWTWFLFAVCGWRGRRWFLWHLASLLLCSRGYKNRNFLRYRHRCMQRCINASCPFGILRLFVVPVVSLRVGIEEVSEQKEKNR